MRSETGGTPHGTGQAGFLGIGSPRSSVWWSLQGICRLLVCDKGGAGAAAGEPWRLLVVFGQGSGVVPDSGEAILRSRSRPKLPATAGQRRPREKPSPADIVCSKRYAFSGSHVSG